MSAFRLQELILSKRLLIFDFDGTIADSTPLHARAYGETFAPLGIAVDYDRIAGLKTAAAVDQLAREAGRSLDADQRARLIAEKQERARALIGEALEPMAGSLDFIRAARRRFLMALCTAASRPTIDLSLRRLSLEDVFDPVVSGDDVAAGKPDPETFLKALRHHRAKPREALVLEDSDSGVEAARRAGIDVLRLVPPGSAAQPGEADWPALSAALKSLAA